MKMIKYVWLVAVGAALLGQGCATMGKEECLTADWGQIGFEDGLKGYAPERIGRHRKACAEYGVTPDFEAYSQGRFQGLAEYCTPARGYALGRKGGVFPDICHPHPDLERGFHEGFLSGRESFLLESEIKKKKKSLRALEGDVSTLEARIREGEAALSPDCADPAACRQALDRIRALDRELATKKQLMQREKQAVLGLSRTLKAQIAASPY